ncbi:YobI family P-loop NTPase [Kibdelosporangium aridum]|uniref:YobI-like P-loop NTPase domain-containing protein n=1 Tax=Kibdelosporangium aridum TaxID=2030 RepID=A0A1W2AZJ7_KIBAR|nr:hypothetical protein [Kibdelosporangium aridum]SMC65608.1 hypothetical protein SAMN05661093_01192 [Kibdelosporangium aridum]
MSEAEHHAGHSGKPLGAFAATTDTVTASQPPTPSDASGQLGLKSLASQYDDGQHKTYLDLLERAVEDPKNRNIALSGRYGTGKSSVLDKFQEAHRGSTLRLAVSSLAPDMEGVTLTNRIQKEVLKQLVYSARPRTLRHSRFSRRGPLPWWRACVESTLFVGVLGALLALLGRLPSQVATSPGHSWAERAVVWVGIAGLLVVVFAVLRMATYNRFVVSNVSAAGATLTLSAQNHTYFDEYLDEIVYFFDQEPKDIVIFEDLDRYDDPQIFQALRELNTLLNNTPKRLKKIEKNKKPLRFIYAMRDSLFEKIGEVPTEESDDTARAETHRANRTKFFEIVVPVVPFISHRTAREHLHLLLQNAGITDIERPLVEVVAKHATDMRLLLNICNEYLVFAQRLLKSGRVAPELSPSRLFALVAYKNFHLQDFENIARRSSDLDRLYDYHRKLVATSVAHREQTKRELLAKTTPPLAIGRLTSSLGRRLVALGMAELDRIGWTNWQLRFFVDSRQYDSEEVTKPEFWEAVIAARTVTLQAASNPRIHSFNELITLSQAHLEGLFPEALGVGWEERNAEEVREEIQQLDREIEKLRGADFRDLVNANKFTITVTTRGLDEELTFGELVSRTLKSDLACDLVKRGYIDRNFTLYAAQFYGEFTGVDVATFIVQTVQTNSMDINYKFTSPGAFANLLAEAGEDLTRTVSAYNVQLVDYLLVDDVQRADKVVKHLTSNFGSEAEQFLAAFFTSNFNRTRLAARLSHEPWRSVFTYLVSDAGVPADGRTALVDAALIAAQPDGAYDLDSDVGDFLVSHYNEMPAFTEPHPTSELDTVVTILRRAEVLLPSLGGVHEELRTLIVDNNLYELTAENLRAALNINGQVTLDAVRGNDTVYQYCLSNLDAYLDAIEADDETNYSTQTSQTLVDALEASEAEAEILVRVAATASPDSSLSRLTDASESVWPTLAAAKLFRASLANLDAYLAKVGDIDESLGELLLEAGMIHTNDGETKQPRDEEDGDLAATKAAAAVAVLNAQCGIPRPEDRVQLVRSLRLGEPLAATQITPEESNLFALLIEHELVPDDAATFAHIHKAGWTAVRPAIVASNGIKDFLTPDLVDGMVADLVEDPQTNSKIGQRVLDNLADFLPTDESKALMAAAKFAVQSNTVLPLDQIRRVATTVKDANLTVRLLQIATPAASEVTTVLNDLGGKYSYLTTWQRDEFEVPYDEAHRAVFKIVADANLCRTSKKPRKELLVVKRA